MSTADIVALHARLRGVGIDFDRGLTDSEFEVTEKTFGIAFPPDLRAFLSHGLPVSLCFPNWRTGFIKQEEKNRSIQDLLDWPFEGMCFDIGHNRFWMADWGQKPRDLQEAFRIARRKVDDAPKLVPVYSHRFLSCEPFEAGNPVLSVWQTDIIYYGLDLVSYFEHEFHLDGELQANEEKQPRRIRFWSDIIDGASAIG